MGCKNGRCELTKDGLFRIKKEDKEEEED